MLKNKTIGFKLSAYIFVKNIMIKAASYLEFVSFFKNVIQK